MIAAALKHWRLVLIAILGAGWLWTLASLHQERAAHQSTMATHAQEREAAARTALRQAERNIELTKELTRALDQSTKDREQLAAERTARAADARAADRRLRDGARALAAQAGATCSATGPGPTAAEALDLLAGLLDRVAERATELAEYADAAAADARYCRAAYARAREALN